jgi:hypothetical protein
LDIFWTKFMPNVFGQSSCQTFSNKLMNILAYKWYDNSTFVNKQIPDNEE